MDGDQSAGRLYGLSFCTFYLAAHSHQQRAGEPKPSDSPAYPGRRYLSKHRVRTTTHHRCRRGDSRRLADRETVPQPGRFQTTGEFDLRSLSVKLQKNSCLAATRIVDFVICLLSSLLLKDWGSSKNTRLPLKPLRHHPGSNLWMRKRGTRRQFKLSHSSRTDRASHTSFSRLQLSFFPKPGPAHPFRRAHSVRTTLLDRFFLNPISLRMLW